MSSKTLFLKWCLLNSLAIVFLVYLASQYAGRLHGPSLIAVPVILLAYAWAQGIAGWICWRADNPQVSRKWLLHEAKYVHHWAEQIQYLAMLATVFGIWTLLTDHGGNLHDRLLNGGGVAFSATFTGIFCSLILMQCLRMIDNDLDFDSA